MGSSRATSKVTSLGDPTGRVIMKRWKFEKQIAVVLVVVTTCGFGLVKALTVLVGAW
jgi:hypothetical protein